MKRGKSYLKTPGCILNKKATINPKNKGGDQKCFLYAIIVVLNHQDFNSHPERISYLHNDIFYYYYNWDGVQFPGGKIDWKRFERNNERLALNYLSVPHDEKTIDLAYKSKYNRKRRNQVFLLMITNGEGNWYCIALKNEPNYDRLNRSAKSLSKLFRGIASNHNGDIYCLNWLHSFRTEKHERFYENNDYCRVEMPT